MTTPIVVNPESEADAAVWALTREVASLFASLPWILIGGQMVAIHEAEHGLRPLRSTVDVDALVDVRTLSTATPGRRAASPGRLVRCAARCRWSCLSVRPRSGRRGRAGARPPRPTCGPSDGAAGNDSRGSRRSPGAEPSTDRPCRCRRWCLHPCQSQRWQEPSSSRLG